MYPFENLQAAASYALRCKKVALVFDGPGGSGPNFVVATGREARELEEDGHTAYSLGETARAARAGGEDADVSF